MLPKRKSSPTPVHRFRMSLRDLVIVIMSGASGVAADFLLVDAHVPAGQAVLGGFASFAATLYFLDRVADQ